HLQQRRRVFLDRRPPADARHAPQNKRRLLAHFLLHMRLHREYPRQRRPPAQHDVRRRKTERAAELLAMRHPPAHAVIPPEQPRRTRHVAHRKRRAHTGTRYPLPAFHHVFHRFEPESAIGGGGL